MSSADLTPDDDAARPPGNAALELEAAEAMCAERLRTDDPVDAYFLQPLWQAARNGTGTLQQARASPWAKPACRFPFPTRAWSR